MSAATRRNRENHFRKVIETGGHEPIRAITQRGPAVITATPAQARNFDAMRGLFKWAQGAGHVTIAAAVSVAGKRLFRQQRQMRAKPPTRSDNRLQRPTPFAQSRHVAVIHGQLGKSPFDRECVVGLGVVAR